MSASGDAFRQKLFSAAGMPYTKPALATATVESSSASSTDVVGRRMSRVETLSGTSTRRESVAGQLDGTIRRPSVGQLPSPNLVASPTAPSRRSTVLADLDALSSLSLGPSSNFFVRQKAVKEALVQSIVRRKERNQSGGNSLFLFPSNRNQASTVPSTSETLHIDNGSSDELGESISDLIKLGVQVSSSWLEEELRISPTAKKRFEIFRNPTPEYPEDPTTPQPGTHFLLSLPNALCIYSRFTHPCHLLIASTCRETETPGCEKRLQ